MTHISDLLQTADWKAEKHAPAIEAPKKAAKGELVTVTVTVGKEIAHPNTTEHHIEWIHVWFKPAVGKFPHDLGTIRFSAHGASTEGPNTSGVYTHHAGSIVFKTDAPGTILAMSYCNIHGLWQSSVAIEIS
jgi:superoxide reductase